MARDRAVSDETVTKALGLYAGLVHRVLTDPQRWLGLDDDPPPSAPFPAKAHGTTDAAARVPLLARVLLDRDLAPRHVPVPAEAEADATLDAAPEEQPESTRASAGRGAGAQRAAGTVGQLARSFRERSSMLDERPHGLLVWRAVGKVPGVGIVGGLLDERGGIRRAAKQTAKLLR